VSTKIVLSRKDFEDSFTLNRLVSVAGLEKFCCSIEEYNKLAVSTEYKDRFSGIGSHLIAVAAGIAITTYKECFACRFLTVDADIEHDKGLIAFYTRNGFISNTEINNRHSKTINMRKDLYIHSM
jgi:ribosomal protein S18 acetylase RimI-like enzyme